jgi:hypothetical protein
MCESQGIKMWTLIGGLCYAHFINIERQQDMNPSATALAGSSSTCTCKLKIRLLVREGAPYKKNEISEDNFRKRERKIGRGLQVVA